MNYFDPRTSKALMENRLEAAAKAARRRARRSTVLTTFKERLGVWMVARGEKLVNSKPKIA